MEMDRREFVRIASMDAGGLCCLKKARPEKELDNPKLEAFIVCTQDASYPHGFREKNPWKHIFPA